MIDWISIIGLTFASFAMFSGCTSIMPSYMQGTIVTSPCHGKEVTREGGCPDAAVKDMDGTECHHQINCGGSNAR